MLIPKLRAMAERAWAPKPAWAEGEWSADNETQYRQAWSQFLNIAAKRELPRLDHYAGGSTTASLQQVLSLKTGS